MGVCASKPSSVYSPRHQSTYAQSSPEQNPGASSSNWGQNHQLSGLSSPAQDSSSSTRPRTASLGSSSGKKMERAAKDMLNLIRQNYYNHDDGHLKSSNKMRVNLGSPEKARCEQAYSELVRFRASMTSDSDIVHGTRAHNCGELTGLVAHHCREAGIPCAKLDIGHGHQLAILGEMPSHGLGNDMSQWPSHLCFVDAWAGIHGRANEYPEKFSQEMRNWTGQEKYISLPSGEWTQANDQRWLDLITNGTKAFFN